jgi:ATP-binding cassette, subfamily B, bacterial
MKWRQRGARVPVHLQMTEQDCGPACVAMLVSHLGRNISVTEARHACGTGRDGSTIRALSAALVHFGLAPTAQQLSSEEVTTLTLPAIAYWEGKHFVVVEYIGKRHVRIVDPARARINMSHQEFAAAYSGSVITAGVTDAFTKTPPPPPAWRRYLNHTLAVRRVRGELGNVLLCSVLLQASGLVVPLFTKALVDGVIPNGSPSDLRILGVAMLGIVLTTALIGYIRTLTLLRVQAVLDAHLTTQFFRHLLSLRLPFLQLRSAGDLISRMMGNTSMREMLTNQVLTLVLDGQLSLVYLAILWTVSPQFAIGACALGLAQAALMLAATKPLRQLAQLTLSARAEEQGKVIEALRAVTLVKAAGGEERVFDRWSSQYSAYQTISLRRNALQAHVELALALLRGAIPVVLLWVGAAQVLGGQLQLGTMLALVALASGFLAPFSNVVQSAQQVQTLAAQAERLMEVFSEAPEQSISPRYSIEHEIETIEFRNVSFRFNRDAAFVLRNVSFRIDARERVAFTGQTGSGKSTLLLLILGLYEPTEGGVWINGYPMPSLDVASYRRRCGVVLQDPSLLAGSIRDNITLLEPLAYHDDVVLAAEAAAVHADIMRMPMRYDTSVGDNGVALSGGQRQRVALARAVLTRPSLLLLDEATSHLDERREQEVTASLSTLRCTQIIVAHRLSTIRGADRVFTVANGQCAEMTTAERSALFGERNAGTPDKPSGGHVQDSRLSTDGEHCAGNPACAGRSTMEMR